jgi:hypothetical protein
MNRHRQGDAHCTRSSHNLISGSCLVVVCVFCFLTGRKFFRHDLVHNKLVLLESFALLWPKGLSNEEYIVSWSSTALIISAGPIAARWCQWLHPETVSKSSHKSISLLLFAEDRLRAFWPFVCWPHGAVCCVGFCRERTGTVHARSTAGHATAACGFLFVDVSLTSLPCSMLVSLSLAQQGCFLRRLQHILHEFLMLPPRAVHVKVLGFEGPA